MVPSRPSHGLPSGHAGQNIHLSPCPKNRSHLSEREYILIQHPDQTIRGIVTVADLNEEFRLLTERFLLVEEIEKGVRRLLEGKYSREDLQSVRAAHTRDSSTRQVEGVADLTFGE